MSDELELRVAWHQHVGIGPAADAELDEVIGAHRQPARRYHGVRHVTWVVRHVFELGDREPIADLDAVVAAAFYHDAVYDPRRADNETSSARWAQRALSGLGWQASRTHDVAALIGLTVDHRPTPGTDGAVLVDADLAVLGSGPAAYGAYVRGVRGEYAHIPEPDWRVGRPAVLRAFLDRDHVLTTPTARQRWESRARANLTAELAALTG
ncbi:MAG: hypothetical protein ACK5OX_02290 [Desertimonas sp.]